MSTSIGIKENAAFFSLANKITVVASLNVHPTSKDMCRIRNMYIEKENKEEMHVNKLLSYAGMLARNGGQQFLWDISPDNGILLRYGFTKTKRTRSGDWFIIKPI